ncbi:hypothetical protein A6D98_19910 [Aliivibrio fischeri]|uniref:hypothetical protein n=1 Tax=Aliivibrio fischeri TaxID=668 RepID=UPI00080E653F|nr:hypothetical protein [Aliivibrio fischeri]OCH56682.1 hypothetical protein A6D98_19910 [Aliivibrio fischeri]
MFVTVLKNVDSNNVLNLPSLEDTIKTRYNIDGNTKKPFNVEELSNRIGALPSLLLCSMFSSEINCSRFSVECFIELLAGISGNQPVIIGELDYGLKQTRPFNFTLVTHGFLNDEFEPVNERLGERSNASLSFEFVPEYRVSKSLLRENISRNGSFDLDLKIDLSIVVFADSLSQYSSSSKRICESIPVGSVVVEFDGKDHLKDESVRDDKLRDSMVQSNGSTVFRIQTPYQHKGVGSSALNRANLDILLKGQIEDIKNHFRNRLFNAVNASYLLKSIAEQNVQATS